MSEWKAFGAFAVEWLGMPVEAMPMMDDNLEPETWDLKPSLRRKVRRICRVVLEAGNFGHKRTIRIGPAISVW